MHRRVNDYRYKPPRSTIPQFGENSSETSCPHGDWCVVVVTMTTERLIVAVNHDFLLLSRPSLPPLLFLSALSLLDDEQGHLVSLCVCFLLFLLFFQVTVTFDLWYQWHCESDPLRDVSLKVVVLKKKKKRKSDGVSRNVIGRLSIRAKSYLRIISSPSVFFFFFFRASVSEQ